MTQPPNETQKSSEKLSQTATKLAHHLKAPILLQEHPNFKEGLRSETRLLVMDSVAGVVSPILGGVPPFEVRSIVIGFRA